MTSFKKGINSKIANIKTNIFFETFNLNAIRISISNNLKKVILNHFIDVSLVLEFDLCFAVQYCKSFDCFLISCNIVSNAFLSTVVEI